MDPIERHIKQHFDKKTYPYNEAHWQEAQKLIAQNGRKKRRWVFWWGTGVAALAIIAGSYWTFSADSGLMTNADSAISPSADQVDSDEFSQKAARSASDAARSESDETVKDVSLHTATDDSPLRSRELPQSPASQIKSLVSTGKYSPEERSANPNSASDEINQNMSEQNLLATESSDTPVISLNNKEIADKFLSPEDPVSNAVIRDESTAQNLSLASNETADFRNTGMVDESMSSVQISGSGQEAEISLIAPVIANGRFSWGFVAGYLMQKQFTYDQWLKGAYFGGRVSWALSPGWSIGADVAAVVQEVKAVHFHHNAILGYSFGRDSIVTDMYAKRAVSLQIPLSMAYTTGKHSFAAIAGTRLLLDAQASMKKLHYTNANPVAPGNPALVSRSTVISDKEQLMPEGALAPFSIYTGLRYGWMIGKGWGLETYVTMPIYHADARLDFGTKMAADQGMRFEVGLVKAF